ncbi:MAG: hypothetical protein Q9180_001438 [Flavoplaca navasiana]
MYFFTTLALFSAISLSSAIPTYSSDIRLFPRQQMSIKNCTDGSPVDGAGEKLNLEATAEAHQIDKTAVFGARAASIRTSDGNCLIIDACGGDFRQNLIPVQTKVCLDSTDRNIATQQFDLITKGKHIQQEGEGDETPSQIFDFIEGRASSSLKLQNDNTTCLAVAGGKLGSAECSGAATQEFTLI